MNLTEVQPTPPARLREYLTELRTIRDELGMTDAEYVALAPSMLAVLAERQFFQVSGVVLPTALNGIQT